MASMAVDLVDSKRLDYLTSCFLNLGFKQDLAHSKGFLLYCFMQSESRFRNQGDDNDKAKRRLFVENLLLK